MSKPWLQLKFIVLFGLFYALFYYEIFTHIKIHTKVTISDLVRCSDFYFSFLKFKIEENLHLRGLEGIEIWKMVPKTHLSAVWMRSE